MQTDWFPLWLSLRVATLATLPALAGGLWLAWLLANHDFRGKRLLEAALTLPLVLPSTVLAWYLLVLLGRDTPLGRVYAWAFGQPLVFTWQAAVVAALIHTGPLLVRSARSALEGVDTGCARAARTLGASEWRIFWRITAPLAWRPILAGAVLAFARALGDFGVTLMLAGNVPGSTQTLAVAVYDAAARGDAASARALVLLISGSVLLALYAADRLSPKRVAL